MDESTYQKLTDRTFRSIEDAFEDIDAGEVDCERAGDVLTLTFRGGKRCIVNTQRPTRQIWVAAAARAWHLSYDAAAERWLDDKRPDVELFVALADIVKTQAGVDVRFG